MISIIQEGLIKQIFKRAIEIDPTKVSKSEILLKGAGSTLVPIGIHKSVTDMKDNYDQNVLNKYLKRKAQQEKNDPFYKKIK